MKVKLVLESPHRFAGVELLMTHSPFTIGQEPGCDLRLKGATVALRHCALVVRDHKLFIEDFPGSSGTYLNDEKIECSHEVHHLDQMQVGKLRFSVHFQATTAQTAAPVSARPQTESQDEPAEATGSVKARPVRVPRTESAEIAALLLSMEDLPRRASEPTPTAADTAPDAAATHSDSAAQTTFSAKTRPRGAADAGDTATVASDLLRMFRKHRGAAMVENAISSSSHRSR
jgi:predicted component of type VI protein secretion system